MEATKVQLKLTEGTRQNAGGTNQKLSRNAKE
jgi:hypothetical protein